MGVRLSTSSAKTSFLPVISDYENPKWSFPKDCQMVSSYLSVSTYLVDISVPPYPDYLAMSRPVSYGPFAL